MRMECQRRHWPSRRRPRNNPGRLFLAESGGRPTAASEKQNLNGSFLAVNLKVSILVPDPFQTDKLAAWASLDRPEPSFAMARYRPFVNDRLLWNRRCRTNHIQTAKPLPRHPMSSGKLTFLIYLGDWVVRPSGIVAQRLLKLIAR